MATDRTDLTDLTDLRTVAAFYGRHGVVRPLGAGMDFHTYTCDDLILRVPQREEVAALMDAEHALLDGLPDDLTLDVPRPLGPPSVPLGPDHPVLVYPCVAGTPLCDLEVPVDFVRIGQALGTFLRRLHATTPREVAPVSQIGAWAADADAQLGAVAHLLEPPVVAAAHTALRRSLPPAGRKLVMCHRDLSDEHVLVDRDGAVTGVIDFGDAGPSPWWFDLTGIWMWGGDTALDATCAAYGRSLDDDERELLEHHAVTVAVWDVVHAARTADAAALTEPVSTLREVLRC